MKPVWDVGVIHIRDESYERRVQAIEFATQHDDGAGGSDLGKSDVILVGPSRSSKTPTSIYLAMKGFKAANIPLIRELGEPETLASLSGDKRVFGFVIEPQKLTEIRLKRAAEFGTEARNYTDPTAIAKEVSWVGKLYRKHRWRVIDVTNLAIEETAAIIMKAVQSPA